MSKRADGWRGPALAWTAVALVATAAGPWAAASAQPAEATISVAGDRLTAHVAGASLHETLGALAGALPLRVTMRGDVPELRVWADMSGVEIEEGVRRLLGGSSYVLVHGKRAGAGSEASRLIEIVVVGGAGEAGVVRFPGEAPTVSGPLVARLQRGATGARATDADNRRPRRVDDDTLAEIARHDPDPDRRVAALEAIGRPGMPQKGLGPFAAALEDPEASVRLRALELLRDLDVVPPLSELAWLTRADPSPPVRRMAVALLAAVPGSGGRELALPLVTDPDPEVSRVARQLIEAPSMAELTPTVVETRRQP